MPALAGGAFPVVGALLGHAARLAVGIIQTIGLALDDNSDQMPQFPQIFRLFPGEPSWEDSLNCSS